MRDPLLALEPGRVEGVDQRGAGDDEGAADHEEVEQEVAHDVDRRGNPHEPEDVAPLRLAVPD